MMLLGLDPGREKFGIALGDSRELVFSAILPIAEMPALLSCLKAGDFAPLLPWRTEGLPPQGAKPGRVCLGDGTGHGAYADMLRAEGVCHVIVDEKMTTIEGRALYWTLHPPRGLWRFVPIALRIPPRPVDDLAAWAILKRAPKDV